jgi:cold-inducible RNA-binding protein
MGTFVGNLSFETSEHDLRDLFAGDGRSVSSVTIVTDRASGRSRGFGFVELEAGTDTAATVNATNELHGRELRVSEAHERPNRPRSGGFGRR